MRLVLVLVPVGFLSFLGGGFLWQALFDGVDSKWDFINLVVGIFTLDLALLAVFNSGSGR